MKILIVTSSLPYPPMIGGKIRVWNLLQQIAHHHDVTLVSLIDSERERQFLPHLQSLCTKVETVIREHRRSRPALFYRVLRTMLKGQPPRNGIAYYEGMGDRIRELTHRETFDLIHVEQSHMAPYIEYAADPARSARLVTLYDVGSTLCERILKVQSDLRSRVLTWLDWYFLRRWEPSYLASHFDKCIVVSSVDEAKLHQANPALDLAVIRNGVNVDTYRLLPEAPDSKEILVIGKMNYPPNVDGVLFFYREVFPAVRNFVPDARLLVVGAEPAPEIQALSADPAVCVTGYVEEILPYYERARLSAVPLRAGSGTRLKILESMALGRPVVSTTLGCEGLDVTPSEDLLVADSPEDLAAQTIRLLTDADLCRHLVANGRALVESAYDWKAIGGHLLELYDQVASRRSVVTV